MRLTCAMFVALAMASAGNLTGRVTDGFGHAVGGTQLKLTSESTPPVSRLSVAGAEGAYRFEDVEPGRYTLELLSPGFSILRAKGLVVSEGALVLPELALELGRIADCGGHGYREFVHFLSGSGETGDLSGSVRDEKHALKNATIELLCGAKGVCAKTTTDAAGAFAFHWLPPGSYKVRVTHAGFYPLTEAEYRIAAGMESGYLPIFLEGCANGNCDPQLRPKRIVTCA